MEKDNQEIYIQRFNFRRRLVHWIHTAAFFVLLGTGIIYTTPALSHLAESGIPGTLHRIFAVVFILVPFIYLILDPKSFKELVKESLKIHRNDIGFHLRMPFYILGRTEGIPPQGKMNAGHKLHHILMGILYLFLVISGLALWFGVGFMGPPMFSLMGKTHIIAVFVIVITTLGHVYFTLVYGALPSMISGKVSSTYLKMEHRRWWDEEIAPTVKDKTSK